MMGHTAPNYDDRQEFWKPPVSPQQESVQKLDGQETGQVCEQCGADFVLGSRFCHVCGVNRQDDTGSSRALGTWFDFSFLCDALGQSGASLVAMFMGTVCVVAAAATGFLYSANTLPDWQAIQWWRIEWLLAAIALFAVGILLKK
jgi:hypothetical protein